MKKYWFGDVDERLKKNGQVMCPKCGKYAVIPDKIYGVLPCDKCRGASTGFSKNGWTSSEKIRSRILMPDGSVLTGMAGIRERDRRLKQQKEYDRYRAINSPEK